MSALMPSTTSREMVVLLLNEEVLVLMRVSDFVPFCGAVDGNFIAQFQIFREDVGDGFADFGEIRRHYGVMIV